MRWWCLLGLLLVPLVASGDAVYKRGPGVGITPNIAVDTDGDGSPDYIACGDYDGDGTTEMADIRGCQAALTDDIIYIYVLPGDYAGDAAVVAGQTIGLLELASNTTLECASPDITTLNGTHWISGATGTTVPRAAVSNSSAAAATNIRVVNCGIDGNWPSGWYWDTAGVSTGSDTIDLEDILNYDIEVTQDDHGYATGDGPFRLIDGGGGLPGGLAAATDYWMIRTDSDTIQLASSQANALVGTQIDITTTGGDDNQIGPDVAAEVGGWTPSNVSTQMGIYFRGVDNLEVIGNRIHNTLHTGIYISNSNTGRISDNLIQESGGYSSLNNSATQPCVYLFSVSGNKQENFLIDGNRAKRCEAAAYNTRASDLFAGDENRGLLFTGNYATRVNGHAIAIRSGFDTRVSNTHVTDAGGCFLTDNTVTGYADQDTTGSGVAFDNTTRGVTFDNITCMNMFSPSSKAIQLGAYSDQLTVRNVLVDGTVDSCMGIDSPQRGTLIENITLKNCGFHGIVATGSATNAHEGVRINGLTIDGIDQTDGPHTGTTYTGIQLNNAADYLHLSNFHITGVTNRAIRIIAGGDWMVFENGYMDVYAPKFRGLITEAALGAKVSNADTLNFVYNVTDSSGAADCDPTAGTGTTHVFCRDDGDGTFTVYTQTDHDAILSQGTIDNSVFRNIRGVGWVDEHTFSSTAAVTDTVFSGIQALDDTTYFSGGTVNNPMWGAIVLPTGSSNVTIDMSNIQCLDTESTTTCIDIDGHDDLSANSTLISATQVIDQTAAACDTTCTDGARCIDTDGGAGATLFVCGDGGTTVYAAP